MSIKFQKYELLELFENFPKIIDEEAHIYLYSKKSEYGFELELFISQYEGTCIVTLYFEQNKRWTLYDFKINDVVELKVDENKLSIIKESEKSIIIYFKPIFQLIL